MKVVDAAAELAPAMAMARAEALAAFNGELYLEKYLVQPDIEVKFSRTCTEPWCLWANATVSTARPPEGLEEAPSPLDNAVPMSASGDSRRRQRQIWLPQRRHIRVRLRGRRVLFHRDEHAAAGRASGNRNGLRSGSRSRDAAGRGGSSSSASDRTTSAFPVMPSSARSTPENPGSSRHAPAASPTTMRPAVSAYASIRRSTGYTVPPYYDSMIAKLVVQAGPQHLPDAPAARARRVCDRQHRHQYWPATIAAGAGVHRRRLHHPLARTVRARND